MEYLKVFVDFVEVLEPLNDSERGRLFTAMLIYASTGELPELKGNERFVWAVAKQSIDRTALKNEKLRENGCKGGRPSENQSKPNETKANQEEANKSLYKDKDKDKDNTKEKSVKEKAASRFSPPTVDEVRAYCKERGNKVNAEAFVDFYASKGWKVGGNAMKDWQAAVRTWERMDDYSVRPGGGQRQEPKKVHAQDYTQRVYTAGDLSAATEALLQEALADD